MSAKVFVYGTLKEGHGNHHLLKSSVFMGKAMTTDKWDMLDAGFPVVIEGNTAKVAGEVWMVDDATLQHLDRLESEGRMYHRLVVGVDIINGWRLSKEIAYMYVGDEDYWSREERDAIEPTLTWRW